MIAELGHYALIMALCLAIFQAVLPLIGAWKHSFPLMRSARYLALGQFVLLALSFTLLVTLFVQNDFSVQYVADHSNSALPLQFRVAAVWGAHEGSLLLWVLILAGWALAVAVFSQGLPLAMVARVLGILGIISIGFVSFTLFTSNPFMRNFPVPLDGADLNPLLQDPALIIHPPILYMGYVGLSVAYAFAVAALMGGQLDAAWARWTRPWTLASWVFLTLGIMLGSWWAYYELGWGGWWFWDPVENASFMPWLAATALIHSLAVTDKRNVFKRWTLLLAIFAFGLSVLGTFLVRSGVLVSVHSFASDPSRGAYVLGLFAGFMALSLSLYAWRAPKIISRGEFELNSKESMLLGNNVLLVATTFTILLSTLYPLVRSAMDLSVPSIGPQYYNQTFKLTMLPLLVLMGVGVISPWQKSTRIGKKLLPFIVVSCLVAITSIVLMGDEASIAIFVCTGLATWIVVTACQTIAKRLRDNPGGLFKLPAHIWGMTIAHIGVAIFVVGATLTSSLSIEQDNRLNIGESITLGETQFTLQGLVHRNVDNYQALTAELQVHQSGEFLTTLYPEKRRYPVQKSTMTEAGIHVGWYADTYVSLGKESEVEPGAWTMRFQYKPFIRWVWLGAIIMAIGGMFAAADRRYMRKR